MNYRDLFNSEDFEAYNRAMAKDCAKLIDELLWNGERDELKGALKVIKRVLNLPGKLCTVEEMQQPLRKLRVEAFQSLTVDLVREKLKS